MWGLVSGKQIPYWSELESANVPGALHPSQALLMHR